MQVIKKFKGKCDGLDYNYLLVETKDLFTIQAFNSGRLISTMECFKKPRLVAGVRLPGVDLNTMLAACTEIETRE